MWVLAIGALLAGLAGSPHCVGMCGGLGTAAARSGPQALSWSAGRLTTYAALGAIAGGGSQQLALPDGFAAVFSVALLLWFSARLAELPLPRLPVPAALHRLGAGLLRRDSLAARYAFGLVNGLLPCGLVYAALSLAVVAADPLTGAVVMVAFGLGTVPALALAVHGLRRFVAGSLLRRRLLAGAVFGVGLVTLVARMGPTPLLPSPDGHSTNTHAASALDPADVSPAD